VIQSKAIANPESILAEVKLVLQQVSVYLLDSANNEQSLFGFVLGQTLIEATKRTENLVLNYELASLKILDNFTQNSLYPIICGVSNPLIAGTTALALTTTRSSTRSPETEPLLRLHLDVKPLDGTADLNVNLVLQQTYLIIHPSYIQRMQQFFLAPKTVDLASVKNFLYFRSLVLSVLFL
jgi:hypothetical protein